MANETTTPTPAPKNESASVGPPVTAAEAPAPAPTAEPAKVARTPKAENQEGDDRPGSRESDSLTRRRRS